MTRRYMTADAQGGHRTGPFGAWWAHITPRPQRSGFGLEVPRGRAAGWNVALVACPVAAVLAWGHVATLLAVLCGAATATAVAIYVIGTGVRDGWLGYRPPVDAGEWQEPDGVATTSGELEQIGRAA